MPTPRTRATTGLRVSRVTLPMMFPFLTPFPRGVLPVSNVCFSRQWGAPPQNEYICDESKLNCPSLYAEWFRNMLRAKPWPMQLCRQGSLNPSSRSIRKRSCHLNPKTPPIHNPRSLVAIHKIHDTYSDYLQHNPQWKRLFLNLKKNEIFFLKSP